MRGKVGVTPPGSRPAERSRADDAGLAPKESVIETLCGLPDGLAGRGFRDFAMIPMVRLRRERLLDHESRHRRAFFARPPHRLGFCFCHLLSPGVLKNFRCATRGASIALQDRAAVGKVAGLDILPAGHEVDSPSIAPLPVQVVELGVELHHQLPIRISFARFYCKRIRGYPRITPLDALGHQLALRAQPILNFLRMPAKPVYRGRCIGTVRIQPLQ